MTDIPYRSALIVGTGPGISASLARALAGAGLKVAIAACDAEKLQGLADETGARAFAVDATDPSAVAQLFVSVEAHIGVPEVVIYNASARARGPIADLDPEEVRRAIEISAFGGFLVVQLPCRTPAITQRMELGDRAATLGREFLSHAGSRHSTIAHRSHDENSFERNHGSAQILRSDSIGAFLP
jgi:NAD(P)-dependent dehydrogenase (short-subunit alcohol dehydrogenase family)